MYTRSELRYACYRAKANNITDDLADKIELIKSLLSPYQPWSAFPKDWDVLVNVLGEVKIIKPVTNYEFLHSTLIEASLYVKQKIPFDSFTDEQLNIITQVEQLMLENVMTWENYNRVWGVNIDTVQNQIKSRLYNVNSSQLEVTDDMIKASQKDADGTAFTDNADNINTTTLSTKPMSEQEKRMFEEFLNKKYPNKG